ncbi:triose-phosphate isomerase [Candidatus Jorgensenbacteria bacterium RIFCSPLOWO2_02_FULL_45_12]|uniref:Triosephosphate isomerase n=1 Tax=Candidatus Jorgensenbacteria bacterium RIFCSPHIGHO2_02_FULL_45_20 TaxID=1798470 RepID=A0A1F6BQC8_9BACT|nr:MAG: triose-phosphate isomerase [Candidatus Jorgensenbacteria bacterium RIFCSPHIGHO2_02_FULL_45_20]OGG42293.1 MAG: triose-phosphate isomerase [Candidatus Jorgensenbacteria bacterium RIFCSPLOWO2_02_FULL_45_12]
MKKIIVANWKMNPLTENEAARLARAVDINRAIIVPPFIFLRQVGSVLKRASLGAQDVFLKNGAGAFTGEISPEMLKNAGVKFVIIGHSERRNIIGETDEVAAKKTEAAISAGLSVILCVGEPWAVRREGTESVKKFVGAQVKAVLKKIAKQPGSIVSARVKIAYEPVWAIGTGKTAFPADAVLVSKFIKSVFRKAGRKPPQVLYGGSVNSKNIGYFIAEKEIDGVLVGGASLDAKEFRRMAEAV